MDPNANLARQQAILAEAAKLPQGYTSEQHLVLYAELGDLVEAMDEWLAKGGFLPDSKAGAV